MKQIIALQEYTDKFISLYEGEIRNIQDSLADKLIEEGIVAEHNDGSQGGGDNNTGILEITDDDIIACADENNNVKWLDVLAYVIRKKIGIIPSNMAKKEYIIGFSRPYPSLLSGHTGEYYCLSNVYFQGVDTSAKMDCSSIYIPSGVFDSIREETQPNPNATFNINNITYTFIKLTGNLNTWQITRPQ